MSAESCSAAQVSRHEGLINLEEVISSLAWLCAGLDYQLGKQLQAPRTPGTPKAQGYLAVCQLVFADSLENVFGNMQH